MNPKTLFAVCISFIILGLGMALAPISTSQTTRWKAPVTADKTINPLKGNASAVSAGKAIYDKYCVMCHGAKGRGDGVAAAGLQVPPADHSSKLVQGQSDGALYWKITEGRNPMASYKATLTETQRWQVVCYIRTLANPNAKK